MAGEREKEMKAQAKVVLFGKAKASEMGLDVEIEKAIVVIADKAKAFVAKHEKANNWNQAVNGKFLLFCLEGEKSDVARAVIAHEMSNASAVRQWLAKEGIAKPTSTFDEF